MADRNTPGPSWRVLLVLSSGAAMFALAVSGAGGQVAKPLGIGTSGVLTTGRDPAVEEASLSELRTLIRQESGLSNEIFRQESWQPLADKMTKGELQLGIFQGYEFAWAEHQHPSLRPLLLLVSGDVYAVVEVLVRRTDSAGDFAGLEGYRLALVDGGQRYLRLFVDRNSKANGKDPESFFSRIVPEDNVESALDDVVDGVVQATVVDHASLELYRQRKPGRVTKLKVIVRSLPLPPVVLAYDDHRLSERTLARLSDGPVRGSNTDISKRVLGLFRLSSFEPVPADFEEVLARTRKLYPATVH